MQMRLFFSVLLLSLNISMNWAYAQNVKPVKFVSFNIEWFGLGGRPDNPFLEHREKTIKSFLNQHVLPADVISFEEIVNPVMLRKLLPTGWTCITYKNSSPTHQHVVLCANDKFKFTGVGYDKDNDGLINSVAINSESSRPALRVNLVDKATNRNLITVVSVHLKSAPNETGTRQTQIRAIGADLKNLSSTQPYIIMGDFNSFNPENSDLKTDEKYIFANALNAYTPGVNLLDLGKAYTYRTAMLKSQFDLFYVRGAKVKTNPKVFSVCNNPQKTKDFYGLNYYNYWVSDHCPVSVELYL